MSYYTDIDLSFDLQNNTDIKLLKDDMCIKNAIMNLLLFSFHDIYLNDNFGGFLKELLFESDGKIVLSILNERIDWILKNYEPRIKVDDVSSNYALDNTLEIKIIYTVIKTEQKEAITYIRDIAHENRLFTK